MVFAHPDAWFWALLAVPLVLLHLRRRRPRRVVVATGFLWRQVLAPGVPRTRWLGWRPVASAAADLAVLMLIVAAMAEPVGERSWPAALTVAALAALTVEAWLFQQRWLN